jgi:hypothetical protein
VRSVFSGLIVTAQVDLWDADTSTALSTGERGKVRIFFYLATTIIRFLRGPFEGGLSSYKA